MQAHTPRDNKITRLVLRASQELCSCRQQSQVWANQSC